MKKQIFKFLALLIFTTSVASAVSGCSVEYRQRHHHDDHGYHN